MSEALKQLLMLVVVIVGGVKTSMAQSRSPSPAIVLQSGMEKEDVDGDLKGAMAVYQRIAGDSAAPRDVRAKALLRLAGCDEKLGEQAKRVYEQILRDYSDQPAALIARRRLAAIRLQERPARPNGTTLSKIDWSRLGRMDASSTDGTHAVYLAPDGNLYFSDLTGANKHLLLKNAPKWRRPTREDQPYWTPSPDFSMVALALDDTEKRPAMIAVINADGSGYREVLADHDVFPYSAIDQVSWAWDRRHLVARINDSDGGKLLLISVADGHVLELAHIQTGAFGRSAVSPDGSFVAYEVMPGRPQEGPTRIMVVPVRGGAPTQAFGCEPWYLSAVSPACQLQDWSADGRYLAIRDTTQGRQALYLLPMKKGFVDGNMSTVRYGYFESGHTTLSGSLVFQDPAYKPSDLHVFQSSLDLNGHLGPWRRMDLRTSLSWSLSNQPGVPWTSITWDGRAMVYPADDEDSDKADLVFRDLGSGKERVLHRFFAHYLLCQSAVRHPKVLCMVGSSNQDDIEIVSVSIDSGSVDRLGFLDGQIPVITPPLPMRDDSGWYFGRVAPVGPSVDTVLTRLEFSSPPSNKAITVNDTNEIASAQTDETLLSRDDKWVLRYSNDHIRVRPIAGGDWREIVSGLDLVSMPETTLNGKWVLFIAKDKHGTPTLYRVPIEGGDPQRIGDVPKDSDWCRLFLSPDDSQVFLEYHFVPNDEIWLLENYVPSGPD